MSQSEAVQLIKSHQDIYKISWEQTRTLCFYNMITFNGTKHIKKPKDLFLLPWEVDDKPKGKTLEKDEFMNIANKIINGK